MTEMFQNISNMIRYEFTQASFWFGSGRESFSDVLWFLIVSGILVALGVIFLLLTSFILKNNPPKQKFVTPFVYVFLITGVVGLIFGFFRKEGVSFFSAYAFWVVDLLAAVSLTIFFAYRYFKFLPGEIENREAYLLKQKYLPKRKKKK